MRIDLTHVPLFFQLKWEELDLKLHCCLCILASRSFPGYAKAPLSSLGRGRVRTAKVAFPLSCQCDAVHCTMHLLTPVLWLLISKPLSWKIVFIIIVCENGGWCILISTLLNFQKNFLRLYHSLVFSRCHALKKCAFCFFLFSLSYSLWLA